MSWDLDILLLSCRGWNVPDRAKPGDTKESFYYAKELAYLPDWHNLWPPERYKVSS